MELSPITMLDGKLRAAGVPIDGVSPDGAGGWTVYYDPSATQAQRDQGAAIVAAFDGSPAALSTWLTAQARAMAQALLDAQKDHVADLLRAIVLVLLDELNTLRQRDRDRAADVAAATSLADLKTRWAARPSLADRTAAQARAAVAAKLSDGSADA